MSRSKDENSRCENALELDRFFRIHAVSRNRQIITIHVVRTGGYGTTLIHTSNNQIPILYTHTLTHTQRIVIDSVGQKYIRNYPKGDVIVCNSFVF